MDTSIAMSENAMVAEYVLRMAAAMRVICIDNQIRLQHQNVSVSCPPRPTAEIEFTGRVPFGFAFTEGHEAIFHVPSRHRFVIEHLIVSGSDDHEKTEVGHGYAVAPLIPAHLAGEQRRCEGADPGAWIHGKHASV